MSELIVCSKCGQEKDSSEFWFDKRRNRVRKPCRDCSNKKSSLTDRLLYENNLITRSDVLNHYKGKNLPNDILGFFTDLIILNRNIKKMEKPLLKSNDLNLFLLCPTCGVFETIELPCGAENMIHILNTFTEIHNHNEIQRIRNKRKV